MESYSENDSARSQNDRDDYQRPVEDHSQINNVSAFISQTAWVFEPLRPFYDSMKSSCSFANNCFSMVENWVCQLVQFLINVDLRGSVKDEIKEIPETVDSIEQVSSNNLDPIIKQLYKLWFQAYQNLLASVDYIANMYEEIVPLLPGDIAWDKQDNKNLSIRELCFYATLNMSSRLWWHSKKYLQHTFTFFNEESQPVKENSTT